MGSNNINSREEFAAYIKKYQVQFEIAAKKHAAAEAAFKKVLAALELPAPSYAAEQDAKQYAALTQQSAKALSAYWAQYSDEMDDIISTTRRSFKKVTGI